MPDIEQFAGQHALITKILSHPVGITFQDGELERMDKPTLQRAAQWVRENPSLHHAPGTRDPLPVAPVVPRDAARPIEALPAWAQDVAMRNPTRKPSAVPAKRWRAVVWDAERCLTVHLGTFDSIEARDAAVQAAKDRRAIGLPLKPL